MAKISLFSVMWSGSAVVADQLDDLRDMGHYIEEKIRPGMTPDMDPSVIRKTMREVESAQGNAGLALLRRWSTPIGNKRLYS